MSEEHHQKLTSPKDESGRESKRSDQRPATREDLMETAIWLESKMDPIWMALLRLQKQQDKIMSQLTELTADLKAAKEEVQKIRKEQTDRFTEASAKLEALTAKVAELEAIIAAGTGPEMDAAKAAMVELKSALQDFDDVIVDPASPPPAEPPTTTEPS